MNTIPRVQRDCNELSKESDDVARTMDLVDFESPHWGAFLVLSSCLKEEMGGYTPEQEQSIQNEIWQLIERQGITQRLAMDYTRERRAQRRKQALNGLWQKYTEKLEGPRH